MNYKEVKHTKDRFEVAYSKELNIQLYGSDNLYPQMLKQKIEASPTGSICLDRYATFIEGNGFNNVAFSSFVCNRKGDTIDDLLHLVCTDLALYRGFAIHVNYNLFGEIVSMTHLPFECLRLEEETEDGKVVRVAYHPDWRGEKTRKGKKIQVNKANTKYYFLFNPNKEVVFSQIVRCGGIGNYSGQVLWFSFDGNIKYPTAKFDSVITNLSTDEGLDNVKYRNVRNNFLPSGMLMRKKGASLTVDVEDEKARYEAKRKREEDAQSLKVFMGDENTGSMMEVELEDGDEMPEWKPIESVNFDKKFDVTTQDVEERIYSAFGQEPFYCIRIGKTGFSGDVLSDAYDYYNSYVSRERRCVSRAIERIVNNWSSNINMSGDFSIQPLVLVRQKDNNM